MHEESNSVGAHNRFTDLSKASTKKKIISWFSIIHVAVTLEAWEKLESNRWKRTCLKWLEIKYLRLKSLALFWYYLIDPKLSKAQNWVLTQMILVWHLFYTTCTVKRYFFDRLNGRSNQPLITPVVVTANSSGFLEALSAHISP